MSSENEYREKAEEARKQADLSISDVQRAAWLRMAQGWLDLIRNPHGPLTLFGAALSTLAPRMALSKTRRIQIPPLLCERLGSHSL